MNDWLNRYSKILQDHLSIHIHSYDILFQEYKKTIQEDQKNNLAKTQFAGKRDSNFSNFSYLPLMSVGL